MPRRQYIRQKHPRRVHPQPVGLSHHPRHCLSVLLQGRLRRRHRHRICGGSSGAAAAASLTQAVHDREERAVRHALLQRGHLRGDAVLLPERRLVEVVDEAELGGGEGRQAGRGGEVRGRRSEVGLETVAAEGVEEADEHGGSAAANPEESVFEGVAPGGAEEGGAVIWYEAAPALVVLLVVAYALGDEPAELGLGE